MAKVRTGERLREYRESYNYRREYFKRNPGIFGCLWFCSQCYKPLIGEKNVVIDHIIPLSRGGLNRVSNCTAICKTCNSKKSDKIDSRIIKGTMFKMVESNVFRAGRGAGAVVGLGMGVTAGAVNVTAKAGRGLLGTSLKAGWRLTKGVINLATLPVRKGSLVSRLFFLAIYVLAILYVLTEFTPLLDAWVR